MTDLAGPDPTIHRRRLRSELRKAREAAGLTQRQTAEAMDWSLSKLIRIETGDVRVSTNDLRAMLTYYTVDPERICPGGPGQGGSRAASVGPVQRCCFCGLPGFSRVRIVCDHYPQLRAHFGARLAADRGIRARSARGCGAS